MRVLAGHEGGVHGVALSADGRWAVSGSADKTVRVWDLNGSQIPRVLVGHEGAVRGVALSADAHRVVSCSYDKTVRVWELADSLCLATFTCDAYVSCCAWAGSWIAAGDSNGQFHLFLLQE
jgi:WD40 repeat protein